MKLRLPATLTFATGPGVLRILLLMMVWGCTAFLWGSLGAWVKHEAVNRNRGLVREQMETVRAWLDDAVAPVQKLAADERLQVAVNLAGGVESPPVLRVLYEYAYQHNVADVYVVDLSNDAFNQIAGAAKLRPEVWERLKLMKGDSTLLVGAGERNGVVYVAAQVKTPLPHRVFVMVPYTLGMMAATLPEIEMAEDVKVGILLPHTGGLAWWKLDEQRFEMVPAEARPGVGGGVLQREGDVLVTMPVEAVPNVWLGVARPRLVERMALLPQALMLAWALTMTVVIIWKPIAPLRRRIVAPESALARGLGSFGRAAVLPFAYVGGRIAERLAHGSEQPLIDGPGDFLPGDFGAPRTIAARSGFLHPVERTAGGKNLHAQEIAKAVKIQEVQSTDLHEMARQQEERDMKEIIKRCLREGRMSLLYQPVFEAATNRPVMHEVFVRLIRPDGEIMTPAQFLPTANKFGLTQTLDAAVFRKVLSQHFAGPEMPTGKMALNVSGTSLDGIAYLQELLNNGQHTLKYMVFEVRSQEIVRDPRALKLLKDIQGHGGKLSVDYFGGGEAMLGASKVMGFDYVKLDASRFYATPEGREQMAALCATAAKVGLPMVVEKIENAEVEEFCRAQGAIFLQGYGLSRPSEKVEMALLERVPTAAAATPENVDTGADKADS